MNRALVTALTAIALAAPAAAQQSTDNTFTWDGKMAAGSWLRIRNLNGSVDVERADGDVAQVRGEKEWRRGDPRSVRFQVVKDGENVTVCALWDEDDRCDESGYHSHGHHHDEDNDVSVRFTVRLPKGVKVDASTVNGGVDVRGAQAEVVANTVNGRVDASTTTGPVSANTVNGSLHVRMDALTGNGDLTFSTVNGSVTAELPAKLDADLELETVNGSLQTDYPLTVSGRLDPHHIRGTLGTGGRRLRLKTVNGSIELKKIN